MERQGTSIKGELGTAYFMYVSYAAYDNVKRRIQQRGAIKIYSECVIPGKQARVSYLVLK
jgi:hypothetical protein